MQISMIFQLDIGYCFLVVFSLNQSQILSELNAKEIYSFKLRFINKIGENTQLKNVFILGKK